MYVSAFRKELDQSLVFLAHLVFQFIDYRPSSWQSQNWFVTSECCRSHN